MADLERRLKPYRDQFSSFRELPADGLPRAEVTSLVQRLASAEERTWREGYASGAVYNGDPDHIDFLNRVYARTRRATRCTGPVAERGEVRERDRGDDRVDAGRPARDARHRRWSARCRPAAARASCWR